MIKSRFSKFQALVGKTSIFVVKPQVTGILCTNMQSCLKKLYGLPLTFCLAITLYEDYDLLWINENYISYCLL